MSMTRRTVAALVVLAGLTLACVSVQDAGRPSGGAGAGEQPRPQTDSGFTVGETAVPVTVTAAPDNGFTVNETVVPATQTP
jgi:hypothetical protein